MSATLDEQKWTKIVFRNFKQIIGLTQHSTITNYPLSFNSFLNNAKYVVSKLSGVIIGYQMHNITSETMSNDVKIHNSYFLTVICLFLPSLTAKIERNHLKKNFGKGSKLVELIT